MAITTTDKKLRVLRTNNFKNKAASERQQFDNDAIIFDASGGIYIGDGVNKEPILVAGAISTKDANTGVIDDPTVKGSRKVKDLIDNQTQEPIYIKGHAQATFMSDGRTVEEAVDTSNFATKTELAQKQDKLVSGTNIKSINGESLVGSGNIAIPGKDVTGVIFTINGSDTTAGANAEIFNDYTNNIASGKYSHAEGYQTIAKGSYSHAEGYGTFTDGAAAHAEGYNTQATARYAHAEGASCIASGNNSHAEGNESKSIGHYSHAEGNFTTSNGAYSHTEGNYAKTGTNGTYAHAEGSYTEANSTGSHAEGNYTIADAAFTHTEGNYTKASSPYQHVRGKYNAIDTEGKYNTIIGNGTSESDRRNIFTIDWDGNVICDGKITINDSCEIVNNGDLVTLKYLQTVLNNNETVTSVKINGVTKNQSSGVVDLGYVNKQLSTTTSSSMTLSPNIYYRNTNTSLSSLTITLGSVSNSNILNEYFVEFTTRDTGTTVSLPSSIKWANGVTPTFENGKTYQISIVNNLGICVKFG